ncbi:MAG: hypothetical protein U1A26_00280 [Candidatus Sungbacteria bacterium]|nr:hypothetical protein [Candidatus Sungbacteria bacterium]
MAESNLVLPAEYRMFMVKFVRQSFIERGELTDAYLPEMEMLVNSMARALKLLESDNERVALPLYQEWNRTLDWAKQVVGIVKVVLAKQAAAAPFISAMLGEEYRLYVASGGREVEVHKIMLRQLAAA